MTEKELDLFQFASSSVAEFRAGSPQVMRRQPRKSQFLRVMFDNMSHYPLRNTVAPTFPCTTDASKQPPRRNCGGRYPLINRGLDPIG
jgi:hypothetical protein